jgi:hypothetical protein
MGDRRHCVPGWAAANWRIMRLAVILRPRVILSAALIMVYPCIGSAEVPVGALAAFNAYAGTIESKLTKQLQVRVETDSSTKAGTPTELRLRQGELIIEKLNPEGKEQPEGALLHDWKGTAFVPGATVADFESLMKNFHSYPQRFAPQVITAMVLNPRALPVPDHFTATMRIRQKHVITVVIDTTYDIRYSLINPHHGYCVSRSVKIAEIADAGTSNERALGPNEDHGFLWRLNTYWNYEERDGGLYMQVESVSLTRGIPSGLAWVIGPFVESVPRESLEFTLKSVSTALRK